MALPIHSAAGRRRTLLIGMALAAATVASACSSGPSAAPGVRNDAATKGAATQPKVSAQPLTVSSVSPASGTTGVATDAPLTVTYSAPLTAMPPDPTLSPAVVGNWTKQGNTLMFTPTGGWGPWSTETVTVPAGATAMIGGAKATSISATTTSFTVAAGSEIRAEEMLSELGYLPFTFEPTKPFSDKVTTALQAEPTTADTVSTTVVPGNLVWAWSSVPATLSPLWKPGTTNVMDKGAIMAFESDHGMKMDGVAGAGVWTALLNAIAARQTDANPYTYLVASETVPETLTVYRGGQAVYTTKSNTGVAGATTQQGTFPVYLRFKSTEMKGTNPDGTKYDDPNIPWVAYFNGGDAVHGYPRSSYGWPQSNGCVELPISNAATVWPMDTYGTLVTVTS
jgi:lipoprotein-anchoring transpeptidase ErfK/SrfK